MHIAFIGQLGLPAGLHDATEQRVEGLATTLAAQGAKVTVFCTTPYTPANLNRFTGVELRHIPSLDPRQPGGWLYTFLSVLFLLRLRPEIRFRCRTCPRPDAQSGGLPRLRRRWYRR